MFVFGSHLEHATWKQRSLGSMCVPHKCKITSIFGSRILNQFSEVSYMLDTCAGQLSLQFWHGKQVVVKLEASMNFVPMRLNLWCALVMWHIEFGDMHSFNHALKYFVVLT